MRKMFLFTSVFFCLSTLQTQAQTNPQLNINVFRSPENAFADGVVAIYSNLYSAGIGSEDATKFTNFTETFALLRNGSKLSIEGRPLITGKDSLFFSMVNFSKRNYTISIDASNFANTIAFIEDRYTNAKQAINLTSNTTYPFTVNNDATSNDDNRFIITFINTNTFVTWLGTVNTDWGTSGNWTGNIIPSSSSNVIIPGGTANAPDIASGYQFASNSLEIALGATLTLNNTCVLTAGSTVINNGSIVGAGKIALNGSLVQSLTGTGTYSNLEMNNGAGGIIPAGNRVNITGKYMPSAGSLTNNGSFVLKSTAAATAAITQGSGSYFTGNITVERYIPSDTRKRYTLVSSPVNNPTIYNAWQEAGINTNTGYGTMITGAATGNGFDAASASGLASIFSYNDNNASGFKWVGLANTDATNLAPGNGFLIYVRGDRAITPSTPTGNNTALRATGTLSTGTVTISSALTLGAGKFSIIANPYPCTIDWNSLNITKTNLAASFTVYDPNLGVFVTSNGSLKSPNVGQQQVAFIQSGQAFFIQNDGSGNTPSITFTEAAKTTAPTTSSSTTVFGSTAKPQLNINVYSTQDNAFADGVVAVFDKNFKAGFDKEDAHKMNNFLETFSLKRNNENLSIEGRPLVTGADTLFFSLNNFSKKEYSLHIDGSSLEGVAATLVDRYTNTKQNIDLTTTTTYKFTVTNDPSSASADRFIIALGSTVKDGVVNDIAANNLSVKLSPNPVSNQLRISFKTAGAENKTIQFINTLGQVVKSVNIGKTSTVNITIPVNNLPAGTYTVQLMDGNNKIAAQKVVKE